MPEQRSHNKMNHLNRLRDIPAVERVLQALGCGAEAATVVNNCAAALVLILRHFTSGERKEVIISRGELIQIGGGFRIPEILEASGAKLREIGTTNKTALDDYGRTVGKQTAMILKEIGRAHV